MLIPAHLLKQLPKHLDNCIPYKGGYRANCPYHDERTGSFFVYDKDGEWWYHCFGCDAHGHVSRLLHRFGYVNVPLYKSSLYPKAQDSPKFHVRYRRDITRGFPFGMRYFRHRGISPEVAKRFGFRMNYDYPSAVFPIYHEGLYQGYIGRSLRDDGPRYLIESGLPVANLLWGADACDKAVTTFIVEGIIDAASLWTAGFQAVALIGKQWGHKTELLAKFKSLVVVPDNYDRQGIQKFRALAKKMGARLALVPPHFKDINDWHVADPVGMVRQLTLFVEGPPYGIDKANSMLHNIT